MPRASARRMAAAVAPRVPRLLRATSGFADPHPPAFPIGRLPGRAFERGRSASRPSRWRPLSIMARPRTSARRPAGPGKDTPASRAAARSGSPWASSASPATRPAYPDSEPPERGRSASKAASSRSVDTRQRARASACAGVSVEPSTRAGRQSPCRSACIEDSSSAWAGRIASDIASARNPLIRSLTQAMRRSPAHRRAGSPDRARRTRSRPGW